jgi:hypothetical protein
VLTPEEANVQERQEKELALQQKEYERQQKESALEEIEELRAKLRESGVNLD